MLTSCARFPAARDDPLAVPVAATPVLTGVPFGRRTSRELAVLIYLNS